ncbi:type I-E CRISPR-associated protein Cas5/CasD [Aeromicrobium sp. CTD01-1L150]|uniref:type I-E CRISPR-associated protein Cas5/CasD n=1 Tax=Aeromicrobium sp. CTD01-1L150 TaxID=3341830 RepID=UPI0035C15253
MTVLLLKLAGPLQAWGSSSRFARRDTDEQPTRSGVLGLLAAAQGRRRTDSLEDLLHLRFGVRVDQPGQLMSDYQTARARGAKHSMLTWRYYLSDALFVAAVESPDAGLLQTLDAALRQPRFPLYLGRRSCPPAGPVTLGLREGTMNSVLTSEKWHASDRHQRRHSSTRVALRVVRDAEPGESGATVRDVPLSFDPEHRSYGWRTVVDVHPATVTNPFGRDEAHDPMDLLEA